MLHIMQLLYLGAGQLFREKMTNVQKSLPKLSA
jgi:hypothetical protein